MHLSFVFKLLSLYRENVQLDRSFVHTTKNEWQQIKNTGNSNYIIVTGSHNVFNKFNKTLYCI